MNAIPLVLNQYRTSSSYKDLVGERYHFPNRYLSRLGTPPVPFVYYEPREGGHQVYFGAGVLRSVLPDTEDDNHSYADIAEYQPFKNPLKYREGPSGRSWEDHKTMRNSVRPISLDLFNAILDAAGATIPDLGDAQPEFYESRLSERWADLVEKHDPISLRKKKKIMEAFERPSWITNHVKLARGDSCALCGQRGFVKRDGNRYCEVHHLFHLSDHPPDECLKPEFLVVLCANCHRRMHYGNVSDPIRTAGGWSVRIDSSEFVLKTE